MICIVLQDVGLLPRLSKTMHSCVYASKNDKDCLPIHVGWEPVHDPSARHVLKLLDDEDNMYPGLQKKRTVAPCTADVPTTLPFAGFGNGWHVMPKRKQILARFHF